MPKFSFPPKGAQADQSGRCQRGLNQEAKGMNHYGAIRPVRMDASPAFINLITHAWL
jgi:hypothetical protein